MGLQRGGRDCFHPWERTLQRRHLGGVYKPRHDWQHESHSKTLGQGPLGSLVIVSSNGSCRQVINKWDALIYLFPVWTPVFPLRRILKPACWCGPGCAHVTLHAVSLVSPTVPGKNNPTNNDISYCSDPTTTSNTFLSDVPLSFLRMEFPWSSSILRRVWDPCDSESAKLGHPLL